MKNGQMNRTTPKGAAGLQFIKMHGLGNDFVVIDARERALSLSLAERQLIADRRLGVGCDQLVILEPPKDRLADVFMRIHNPDGGEAEACGNATRCVAAKLMHEKHKAHLVVETVAGLLDAEVVGGDRVAIDMGLARSDWREIPLAQALDTLRLPIEEGPLHEPVAVNIGNPHMVFFVADAEAVDLARLGPILERHAFYPQRANVEIAQIIDDGRIRMRVWERGAGITRACGSGACATLVAAARRKLTGRKADIVLDGGVLQIEWLADGHVRMTGGWAESYRGEIDLETLSRVHG
jgi:diaminopimelate epimerase